MTQHTHPLAHPHDPHRITRSGWLRAAVLGANDGIVSVASLILGVAASNPEPHAVLIAGVAGLSAGALSMAAGEYVSVSSQSDIERADIRREKASLRASPEIEMEELIAIYESRGLAPETARLVATELTEHDALGAHVRDELGLMGIQDARPVSAAIASALTFGVAGAMPLLAAVLAPTGHVIATVIIVTALALALLGVIGAKAGGAPWPRAVVRVLVWGGFAMAVTSGIGYLFGVAAA
ncbi:MAG: hypothetical protein DI498_03585 [Paracoccus denitrificans]|nr:MAG: hypothetical protein DI498_03585 [Paracoccus denitrificans]PZO85603.1 MAG: hypothetical protein DI633_03585 [Paracoccus denitrificans]